MSATTMTMREPELKWELSVARTRGDVRSDRRRVRDLHHFCRGVSVLSRQESDRPHAEGRSRGTDLLHDLLLSSSLTIHFAVRALRGGSIGGFEAWWFATIALGATFLYGTAHEWHRLIYQDGLTISTNLFGTTYYSLVGLARVSRDCRA